MAVLKPLPHGYYLWLYIPSKVANTIFVVLFALATILMIWRSIRTKARYSIPFIIGGLFQTVGYIGRVLCVEHTDKLAPFVLQSILILVAPALFAASIYMTLGRLIRSVNAERHSMIPLRWLTKVFVTGDIVSFLLQGGGGGLQASASTSNIGEKTILAGLFLQIIIFGFFVVMSATLHVRLRRWPTEDSIRSSAKWQGIMAVLYSTSIPILVRSVFRVVEYAMGRDAYLIQHEWPTFVFDSALMVITMVIFGWWFPGNLKDTETRKGWDFVGSPRDSGLNTAHSMSYPLKSNDSRA
ncbi:hypothetical protein Golomagni_06985 [Golovinomyces magnicellulatus]|nr:hypothetical protein Golomagni_06985 [Golovinomyces magnicellulatus]